jgi:hypothetical protein
MDEVVRMLKQLVLGDLAAMVVTGVVKSVDKTECTCDVDPDDEGAELVNVRLRSVLDGAQDGFTLWPKVGSSVTVLMLDKNTGLVVQYTAVECYDIRTENDSLKALLKDMIQWMREATYSNGAGPTGPANNVAALTQFDNRLNSFFNDGA